MSVEEILNKIGNNQSIIPKVDFKIYQVTENNSECRCIWCKGKNPTSKAHIFSRRIIRSNLANNYLKSSVCHDCNAKFGSNIEDWLFKYTPISAWAPKPWSTLEKGKEFQHVPNFGFEKKSKTWIVIDHSSNTNKYATQIRLGNDGKFNGVIQNSKGEKTADDLLPFFDLLQKSLLNNDYTTYESNDLPKDFNCTALLHKNKYILIGRSEAEINTFITKFLKQNRFIANPEKYATIKANIGNVQIHYRWSLKKYIKLCSKIAFEVLAKNMGSDFCLNSSFDELRKVVLKDIKRDDDLELIFTKNDGYKVGRFTPGQWILLAENKALTTKFNKLSPPRLLFLDQEAHWVVIYSHAGLILASVSLFGLDMVNLVLGNMEGICNLRVAAKYKLDKNELEFLTGCKPSGSVRHIDCAYGITNKQSLAEMLKYKEHF